MRLTHDFGLRRSQRPPLRSEQHRYARGTNVYGSFSTFGTTRRARIEFGEYDHLQLPVPVSYISAVMASATVFIWWAAALM
ncbi:hypothetical protein BST30_21840 [Mycobacterium mantenii]|uniref:Uncharacterized protein n=1 Tax=Mycobacterium mantenii TaxID=560555 RepID=A0A1X0FH97_MYCNT|nr:hypothetical protein BST30_21840 [Mycobacterium mantenii]